MHPAHRWSALALSTAAAGALFALIPAAQASAQAPSDCRSPNLLYPNVTFPEGTNIPPTYVPGVGPTSPGRICQGGAWHEYWK